MLIKEQVLLLLVGIQVIVEIMATPEAGYAANPYLTNYGMNPILASAESFPQYGPRPGSWGAYNKQQLS